MMNDDDDRDIDNTRILTNPRSKSLKHMTGIWAIIMLHSLGYCKTYDGVGDLHASRTS
jgi:hypothetical protein